MTVNDQLIDTLAKNSRFAKSAFSKMLLREQKRAEIAYAKNERFMSKVNQRDYISLLKDMNSLVNSLNQKID